MYSQRQVNRDQELHDHYARNAIACGHEATCQKVVGFWKTIHDVWVNWPTIRGRARCTCSKENK